MRPPLSMTMSIRRSLSALKGAPLSTWWRIDIRLKVRESAWTRGWHWLTCAPDRCHNRACRVLASVVPQQGHLVARTSPSPENIRPADANSEPGRATGLALKKAMAPGLDCFFCPAFTKPLVSFSPFGSPVPRGGVVSGSCSRNAT